MRFIFFSAIILFFSGYLYPEEFTLYDSGESNTTWQIVPDGYINSNENNNSSIKTVYSENYGDVLGVSLEYSALDTPSYYILKPEKDIRLPDLQIFNYLRITVYSNWSNLDVAFLLEDNSGIEYEYYVGTLDFYGWKTLLLSLETKINGILLKGIVFYNKQESGFQDSNKVFYIKQITTEGYSGL